MSIRNSSVALETIPASTAAKDKNPVKGTAIIKPAPKEVTKEISAKVPGFFEVKGLLVNYTCTACHTTTIKQIGPGYIEIAKRNYSNEKIVELIHNPQPQNWPDYETAMPPMPQVTLEDATKIAAWINSLDD